METLLRREGALEYLVSDVFDPSYLEPVRRYAAAKPPDGYDEAAHCAALIAAAAKNPAMKMEFELLRREGRPAGLALLTAGALEEALFFPPGLAPRERPVTCLNYFHIVPEARGVGTRWLRELILPRATGPVYVKSSHPRAFSLYDRLGVRVGAYTVRAEGGGLRPGVLWRIPAP